MGKLLLLDGMHPNAPENLPESTHIYFLDMLKNAGRYNLHVTYLTTEESCFAKGSRSLTRIFKRRRTSRLGLHVEFDNLVELLNKKKLKVGTERSYDFKGTIEVYNRAEPERFFLIK